MRFIKVQINTLTKPRLRVRAAIVYSGEQQEGQRGVAPWIHSRAAGALLEYDKVNDRTWL